MQTDFLASFRLRRFTHPHLFHMSAYFILTPCIVFLTLSICFHLSHPLTACWRWKSPFRLCRSVWSRKCPQKWPVRAPHQIWWHPPWRTWSCRRCTNLFLSAAAATAPAAAAAPTHIPMPSTHFPIMHRCTGSSAVSLLCQVIHPFISFMFTIIM